MAERGVKGPPSARRGSRGGRVRSGGHPRAVTVAVPARDRTPGQAGRTPSRAPPNSLCPPPPPRQSARGNKPTLGASISRPPSATPHSQHRHHTIITYLNQRPRHATVPAIIFGSVQFAFTTASQPHSIDITLFSFPIAT